MFRPRTSMLCLFISIACQIVCIADDLEILVPSNLGEVKFGDPLFVSIAIANYGDDECPAPILDSVIPGICFVVYPTLQSATPIETNFDLGSHSPRIGKLKARHAESTVFALNIWHPSTSTTFADGEQIIIEVTLPRDGNSSKTQFRTTISGSAFVNPSEFVVLANTLKKEWDSDRKMIHCIGSKCRHLSHVHGCDGVAIFGPFSWGLYGFPKGLLRDGDGKISELPYYRQMRNKLRSDSALFRVMQCAELREKLELSNTPTGDDVMRFIVDYKKAMTSCPPLEYQYLVRALTQVNLVEANRQDFKRIICREFSDVLGFVDPMKLGGISTLSHLTEEK